MRLGGCSGSERDLVDSRGRSLLDQVPACVIGQCRGFRSRSRQPFGHHVVQWQGVRIHDAMGVRQRLRPVVEDVRGRPRRCDRADRRARTLGPDSGVLDGDPDHGVGVNVVCRRIPGRNADVQHPNQGTLEHQSVLRFSIHRHWTGRRRVGCRLPRSLATRQDGDPQPAQCIRCPSRARRRPEHHPVAVSNHFHSGYRVAQLDERSWGTCVSTSSRGGVVIARGRSGLPRPQRDRRDRDDDSVEQSAVVKLADQLSSADEPDVFPRGGFAHRLVDRTDVATDEADVGARHRGAAAAS